MARDRRQYFDQLAATSRKYYIPYLSQYMKIGEGVNVLEIGCGEGGNLLPFAEAGCSVLGVDLSGDKIRAAEQFFAEAGAQGRFLASDIFAVKELEGQFDLIVCHDVIEHIGDKEGFMRRVRAYLKPGTGLAFIAFPAWQMPFGGHQQMCTNRRLARLPYFHLLPAGMYRRILERGGESPAAVAGFLEIKDGYSDRALRAPCALLRPAEDRPPPVADQPALRGQVRPQAPPPPPSDGRYPVAAQFLHHFLFLLVEVGYICENFALML